MAKLTAEMLGAMQRDQYKHDMRNHFDILSLHKCDRLKHYGLHFCKYAGRMARGAQEPKCHNRTVVDIALVMLSAANTLHQDLSELSQGSEAGVMLNDSFLGYVDAAGRFADACEKIDHLEEFTAIAKCANADIAHWLLREVDTQAVDLPSELGIRRQELASRHFYLN